MSGVVIGAHHPTRKLVVRVSMPGWFRPEAIHSIAHPSCVVTDPPMPTLSSLLAPPPCHIEMHRGRSLISLTVKQAQAGTRYGITWRVP